MYRLLLATRYLFSRPINLLGVLGIALGVWALIVVPSIFTGYLREVGKHLQSTTADATIRGLPGGVPIETLDELCGADPAVAGLAPRLLWQGLLHPAAPPSRSRPPARGLDELTSESPLVSLLGIDTTRELHFTGLGGWLRAAPAELQPKDLDDPLRPIDGEPAALLSPQRMARDGLRLGDRIAVTIGRLDREDGEEVFHLDEKPLHFRVAGAFESSFAAFDGLHVFVDLETLAARLGGDSSPNEVAVQMQHGVDTAQAAERLERILQAEYGRRVRVATWSEANRLQLGSIDHQRGLMKLVLFVIMVVAGFVVYATLSMMVTEKTRDIGILTAMGADVGGVATVFVACGAAVAVIGAVVGVVGGCLSAVYLDDFNTFLRRFDIDLFPVRVYNLRRVPYDLDPLWIAQVSGISVLVTVAVAAIPAWRAARQDPLDALRHE